MTGAALTAIQFSAFSDILALGTGKCSYPTHHEHNDADDEMTHSHCLPYAYIAALRLGSHYTRLRLQALQLQDVEHRQLTQGLGSDGFGLWREHAL